jgi:hypothetical protein
MRTPKTILVISMLVGTCLSTTVIASPMLANRETPVAATEDVEIPPELINEPTPTDPNGPCSHCRVYPLKSTAASGYATAEFDLYFADDGDDLDADIEVTVLLASQQYRYVMLEDIELIDETTDNHEVPSGGDWDWDDVTDAWVEVIPL